MGETVESQGACEGFGRYPIELAGEFDTISGITVYVRPICPDDAHHLVQFHEGLSAQSVYRRFFFMHPHLSPTEIERFTRVDYLDRLALVAECDGRLVGIGRYERIDGTADAEVAFVVADDFQQQGVATNLLERLAEAARTNGIEVFVAQTLAENHAMLDVFTRSGFHMTFSTDFGTVSVRFPIEPDDASRTACMDRHRDRPPYETPDRPPDGDVPGAGGRAR